VKRKSSIS